LFVFACVSFTMSIDESLPTYRAWKPHETGGWDNDEQLLVRLSPTSQTEGAIRMELLYNCEEKGHQGIRYTRKQNIDGRYRLEMGVLEVAEISSCVTTRDDQAELNQPPYYTQFRLDGQVLNAQSSLHITSHAQLPHSSLILEKQLTMQRLIGATWKRMA